MRLNLITFASSLASRESVFTDHCQLLDRIAADYDVRYIFPEQLTSVPVDAPSVVFVGSGGVEEMVKAAIGRLPSYVVLVADGLKNSLAASLEILSWMRMEGRSGRVLHGDTGYILQALHDYCDNETVLSRLAGKKAGVIGQPSGWLIASGVDYQEVQRRWGIRMEDIPLQEVVDGYGRCPAESVTSLARDFVDKAVGMKETNQEEIVKAMRLYQAVKEVVERHQLDAFTLNCFDLIPLTRTTGCVALALLNQEGIPAGCEGDMQTLLTMLLVQTATGQPCFMANPSKIIDNARRDMIFAHCTIAPSMTDRYVIRNHYESLSGVAIEGIVGPSDLTIVKAGGRKMERYFMSRARLTECTDNPIMCRTQMRVTMEQPLDYFLTQSIGNHHVIVRGDFTRPLSSLFSLLDCKEV